MRRLLPLVVLLCAACELSETSIAEPEDVVVAEVLLVAGAPQQLAVLHRTFGGGQDVLVPAARIEVQAQDGSVLTYAPAPDSVCVAGLEDDDTTPGSCYASARSPSFVQAGVHYTLRVELADGGVLNGVTVVPGEFEPVRPRLAEQTTCRLLPDTTLELAWTQAPGAWVYFVETRMRGLADALQTRGIELDVDPIRVVGISISAADTTLVFPSELGVFDRFDNDVAAALLAIQGGLPPDVDAEVMIAAADRNYVNWVRGGRFNPSGLIRTPSVTGDGTGVFGSVNPYVFRITTSDRPRPAC